MADEQGIIGFLEYSKEQKMKNKAKLLVVMFSLAAVAGLASAVSIGNYPAVLSGDTAVLQFNGMGDNRSATYAYAPNARGQYQHTGNTYAGELTYTVDGKSGYTMWCVDIYQNTSSSKVTYNEALLSDSSYLSALDTLYYQYDQYTQANANSSTKLKNAAAAFQMTMWELAFEKGDYNLNDGWFKVTSTSDANALGNLWLANIGFIAYVNYEKTVWYNNKSQDVIEFGRMIPPVSSVPEPLTMLSMAVAFSAAGRYVAKRLKKS